MSKKGPLLRILSEYATKLNDVNEEDEEMINQLMDWKNNLDNHLLYALYHMEDGYNPPLMHEEIPTAYERREMLFKRAEEFLSLSRNAHMLTDKKSDEITNINNNG